MKKWFLIIIALFFFEGCIQTIAVRSMSGIIEKGLIAFNEESDIMLAHEALASNLKLIEALIKSDPDNHQFLTFAAQGFNAYALAFCEDDSVERARVFYLRAKDYGMKVLLKNKKFAEAIEGDINKFSEAIKTFDKKNVPAVFWTALSWGSYINITRSDVSALADISKVQAMMEFVIENSPEYYYGGAYLLLGVIEASMPRSLGGNPEKAKNYFNKCFEINKGNFLLSKFYFAKSYAVAMQDQELFESVLREVQDTPIDVLPEARLPNAIAKQKSQNLYLQKNELF